MPLAAFYSSTGLLVFLGALVLSILLYMKNIKASLIPIANLCSLLVFAFFIIYAVDFLGHGIGDPSEFAEMLAISFLMNLYAALFNIAARVATRIMVLMGNKRLKIRVRAEIVER